jgi:hypothetical protein
VVVALFTVIVGVRARVRDRRLTDRSIDQSCVCVHGAMICCLVVAWRCLASASAAHSAHFVSLGDIVLL